METGAWNRVRIFYWSIWWSRLQETFSEAKRYSEVKTEKHVFCYLIKLVSVPDSMRLSVRGCKPDCRTTGCGDTAGCGRRALVSHKPSTGTTICNTLCAKNCQCLDWVSANAATMMVAVPPLRTEQADSANACKGAVVKSYWCWTFTRRKQNRVERKCTFEDVSRQNYPSGKTKERVYSLGQVAHRETTWSKGATTCGTHTEGKSVLQALLGNLANTALLLCQKALWEIQPQQEGWMIVGQKS